MHRRGVVCTGHRPLGDAIISPLEVMTVTAEEKRARHRDYMRKWRRQNQNRAKEKEYRVNTRRRRALRELLADRRCTDGPSVPA